ncbi:MAG: stage II sporulation protein P, partial [Clostridia bacterium]
NKEIKKEEIKENKLDYIGDIDLNVFSNIDVRLEDSKDLQRVYINNLPILNYSNYRDINFKDLNKKVISLTKNSDSVLLYSTHTSESYANSDKYKFEYNGTARSYDSNYNMLSVKNELFENLSFFNFKTINDTTEHDYGTYTSAYLKSRVTINNNIKTYGNFGISMDIHRDANNDINYRPVVNINGIQVAKCMIVMGLGSEKNKNEYYLENLALAMKIYLIGEKMYPGLFRPMLVRKSVYNQDLNKYSMLFEIGATGNTLDEAYNATRCLANILNKIYKN